MPSEGRKQWRLGPKRWHFGGRLGDGAYVPNAGEPQHRLATAQVGRNQFSETFINNTQCLLPDTWCR